MPPLTPIRHTATPTFSGVSSPPLNLANSTVNPSLTADVKLQLLSLPQMFSPIASGVHSTLMENTAGDTMLQFGPLNTRATYREKEALAHFEKTAIEGYKRYYNLSPEQARKELYLDA
jgi:hypothetical protein